MNDTLYGGRRFLTLNILDEGVREVLAIEVDTSLPAERVLRVLDQVTAWRGQPQPIRLDNGPKFLADRFASWCADRGIALRYIQPGKPNQNALARSNPKCNSLSWENAACQKNTHTSQWRTVR